MLKWITSQASRSNFVTEKLTWPVVTCFSIKEMAENVRFALEKEEKLQEEVLLEDKDFIVDLVEVVSFLWTVMDSNLSNILTCCVRFALLTMGRVYTKYRNFFSRIDETFYYLPFSIKRLLQYNIVGLFNKSSYVHNCCERFIDKKTFVILFSRVAISTCGRAFHFYYPEGKWGTTRSLWTSTFPVCDIYTRI